jgi:hypothetical protein
VLVVIALVALAMFGLGLSDALSTCSGKHWIGCDWGHVEGLGVWLVPVFIVLVIAVVRLIARGRKPRL